MIKNDAKPNKLRTTFGQRLLQLRRQQKISQIEVADKIGVSNSYISQLEHNLHPSLPSTQVLNSLAELYKTPRTSLYHDTTQLDIHLLRQAAQYHEYILQFLQTIANGQDPLPTLPEITSLRFKKQELNAPKVKKVDSNKATLGTRLKKLRNKSGFTKRQLATESGISSHDISRYERGNSISPANLLALARALSTNMAELVDITYSGKIANCPTRLGQFLRRERLKLGLTASKASERAGIGIYYWGHIEKGYTCSNSTLKKLAFTLNLDPGELFVMAGLFDEDALQSRATADPETHELIEDLLASMIEYLTIAIIPVSIPKPKPLPNKNWKSILNSDDKRVSFGMRLRQLRVQHGLLQTQVADAVGISSAYVSKLEIDQGGIMPSDKLINNLATSFQIPRSKIFRGTTQLDIHLLRRVSSIHDGISHFIQLIASGQEPLPKLPNLDSLSEEPILPVEFSVPREERAAKSRGMKLREIRTAKVFDEEQLLTRINLSPEAHLLVEDLLDQMNTLSDKPIDQIPQQ